MSDPKRHINSKFSDYEADADESSMDKSWERVKYFLPPEKKKRRFVFFWFTGYGKAVVALAGILSLAALYLYKSGTAEDRLQKQNVAEMVMHKTTNKNEQENKNLEKNKSAAHEENVVTDKITSENLENKRPAKKENSNLQQAGKNIGLVNDPAVFNTQSETARTEGKHSESSENKYLENAAGLPIKEDQPFAVSLETPPEETISPLYLPLKQMQLSTDLQTRDLTALSVTEINPVISPDKKEKNRLCLELMAGPSFAKITINEPGNTFNKTRTNFSVGLGAAYQFKNQWNINGNFMFSGNRFNNTRETVNNKVVSRQPFLQNSIPSVHNSDTIIRYKEDHTEQKISSKFNYLFNIGFGCTLRDKGKLSLDASVQLSIKYSSYKFNTETYQTSDTLVYVLTPTSQAFMAEVESPEPSYNKTDTKFDMGILPGLTVAYRLNKKLAFFFKPTYFKQLSKASYNAGPRTIKLKQDNLFLNFGVRLYLN